MNIITFDVYGGNEIVNKLFILSHLLTSVLSQMVLSFVWYGYTSVIVRADDPV